MSQKQGDMSQEMSQIIAPPFRAWVNISRHNILRGKNNNKLLFVAFREILDSLLWVSGVFYPPETPWNLSRIPWNPSVLRKSLQLCPRVGSFFLSLAETMRRFFFLEPAPGRVSAVMIAVTWYYWVNSCDSNPEDSHSGRSKHYYGVLFL